MENLLNAIFPPKCLFCNVAGSLFCEDCLGKCIVLKKKLTLSEKIQLKGFCYYEYGGLVRQCIRCSKYSSKQFQALKVLAESMSIRALLRKDVKIIPIPLSRSRARERGFNQTKVIAKILSSKLKLPICDSLLVRVRDTHVQHALGKRDRVINMENAFSVISPEKVVRGNFLLVDDICTSGATFISAAKALYDVGAAGVFCFALSYKL